MLRPILRLGDSILSAPARRVDAITPAIEQLIDDMAETMYAAPGIGLAAPQVGQSLQIFVLDLSLGKDPAGLFVMINPEFVEREGMQLEEEGCLSVPGFTATVARPKRAVVKGLDKKNANIPVVLWFPDHIGVFGKTMFLNADYDFLFFKDPYIVSILNSDLNIKSYYLPECCNPQYHKKIILSKKDHLKYDCDITTAGNMHPNRFALFSQLTEYNCKIWGNPPSSWMNVELIKPMLKNEFVANEEKSKAFSAAKIVINNLQPGEIIGINVRTFEIAACCGFQLINHRAGLNQLYSTNEVIAYHNVQELKELIDYYLIHSEERKIIAERAYHRTINEHSYKHRLDLMLNTIYGIKKGFPYSKDQCDFYYT